MKTIAKLSIIAVTVANFAGSAAFAGNEQLQNLLALQRQARERDTKSTTIAVYADRRGAGQRSAMQAGRPETRFEQRTNAQGQRFGIFVPVK